MHRPVIITSSSLLTLLVMAACTSSVASQTKPTQQEIEQRIEDARYCSSAAECVDVGGKCPFGCYIIVNQAEADEIAKLVHDFDSSCIYDCAAAGTIVCEAGRCDMVP